MKTLPGARPQAEERQGTFRNTPQAAHCPPVPSVGGMVTPGTVLKVSGKRVGGTDRRRRPEAIKPYSEEEGSREGQRAQRGGPPTPSPIRAGSAGSTQPTGSAHGHVGEQLFKNKEQSFLRADGAGSLVAASPIPTPLMLHKGLASGPYRILCSLLPYLGHFLSCVKIVYRLTLSPLWAVNTLRADPHVLWL